jgi:hypothetical protein
MSAAALHAGLIDSNPFIWPGFEAREETRPQPTATAAPDELEFHAVYQLGESVHVLVRDRKSRQFTWTRVGEQHEGFLVSNYNAENNQILVNNQAGEKWLSLQATPQPSGTPVATAPTPATPTRPTAASTPGSTSRPAVRPVSPPRPTSTTTTSSRPPVVRPVTSGAMGSTVSTARLGRVNTNTDPGVSAPNFTPPAPTVDEPTTAAPRERPRMNPEDMGSP